MRTVPTFVVAAIALLALSSCQPDAVPIIPDPVPTSDLLFESEEEALAAAEEAYGAYLAVSNAVLADGGAEPERLLEVAGTDLYESELEGLQSFVESGWRSVGAATVDTVSLQMYDPLAAQDEPVVVVYACLDVSQTDVVDAEGRSVLSGDRQVRLAFETSFAFETATSSQLIMVAKDLWSGGDFCN